MPTSEEMIARSPAALGRAIRAARQGQGLTQSELAERARTNRFAIAQAETGASTKAIEKLFETLAALELELVVRPRQSWKA
ncbi:MAG: helix-turn-helix domain-containing protein [Mycobacterium sp.]|nr:helix-turn-helix domain-containing protein [Mycobacterium sp.]